MHKRKFILFVITIFLIIVGVVFFLSKGKDEEFPSISNNNVNWTFNGKSWQANGNPPECPNPLVFTSPVDVTLASGILYPGQIRGGDYRPHGGFRFDNRNTNDIEVRAIMDGTLLKASRYLESNEEQILVFYVNACGILVMHDHFLTLSPKLEAALISVPLGKEGDSRTTTIEPKVYVKKGEVLATEIGHKDFNGQKNIFVDFGLYDLRKSNGIRSDGEYAPYGLCWFDYLENKDGSVVRSLPAGNEGKVSDYCYRR